MRTENVSTLKTVRKKRKRTPKLVLLGEVGGYWGVTKKGELWVRIVERKRNDPHR